MLATKQTWFGDAGDTITIYYKGTYSDWLKNEPNFGSAWDTGISSSSRVYFLGENGKVNPKQGYLTASVDTFGNRAVTWSTQKTIDQAYINDMYTKKCTGCSSDHSDIGGKRPDYIYWGEEDGSAAITIPTT